MPFNITDYVSPMFAMNPHGPAGKRFPRYVGCCFWINSQGMFATCKHVLTDRKQGEQIVINVAENRFLPVTKEWVHNQIDFAVGTTDERSTHFFAPVSSQINPGLDVSAWGYLGLGKLGTAEIDISARIFKGHVVRMARKDRESIFPAKSICEVSFASLPGFSGTALFHDGPNGQGLVGMLYGNSESTTTVYTSQEEIVDGKSTIIKTERMIELGMAHPIGDIEAALVDLGIAGAFA